MSMVFSIAKNVTGFAVEFGVGTMTSVAVKNLIPESAGIVTKVTCYAGGVAAAGLAGRAVHKYSDEVFDSTKVMVDSLKETRKVKKELKKQEKEAKKKEKVKIIKGGNSEE